MIRCDLLGGLCTIEDGVWHTASARVTSLLNILQQNNVREKIHGVPPSKDYTSALVMAELLEGVVLDEPPDVGVAVAPAVN